MESLKERMAKASTVAINRAALAKQHIDYMYPKPGSGVVCGRRIASLPLKESISPVRLFDQTSSVVPCNDTTTTPKPVYAVM